MSNQFGLMLTFIFLSIFIVFSGEILSYQNTTAKTINLTNQLAICIQENGYNQEELEAMGYTDYFDSYNVITRIDINNGFLLYNITTKKTYHQFSNLTIFKQKDIVCKMSVCRKDG